MDNDLIFRSDVLEALLKQPFLTRSVVRRVVAQVPAVDPESLRPVGEWKYAGYDFVTGDIWLCTNCLTEFCFEDDPTASGSEVKFCSGCGARMEG